LFEWAAASASNPYAFTHDIYREQLQAMVQSARGARFHRRIGGALERRLGHRTGAFAGELARNFESGREPKKAIQYQLLAAEQAFGRSGYQETESHLRKARHNTSKWPSARRHRRPQRGT
jgi:predicted ATPase